MIKKIPLLTWKALLVLWALFLGFMGLIFKLLDFMGQFEAANHRESDDSGFVDYNKEPVVTHDETRWDYDPWLEKK